MLEDAKKLSKYNENYLRTFEKMLKRRQEKGLKNHLEISRRGNAVVARYK